MESRANSDIVDDFTIESFIYEFLQTYKKIDEIDKEYMRTVVMSKEKYGEMLDMNEGCIFTFLCKLELCDNPFIRYTHTHIYIYIYISII